MQQRKQLRWRWRVRRWWRVRWRRRVQLSKAVESLEVLDALGAFEVSRREGTLGGSLPLRAAKACAPLLEGNAYGLQLVPRRPVVLRRSFRGIVADETFVRACSAIAPILRVRGLLTEDEAKRAALGIARRDGTHELFTGLLVKVPKGMSLRVLSAQARASKALLIAPCTIVPHEAFQPLFLRVALRKGLTEARLESDVATLAPILESPPNVLDASDSEREELLRAHLRFYDGAYFASKARGEVTRKYRRMMLQAKDGEDAASVRPCATLATFGGVPLEREASGTLVVKAPFDFSATYDGATVTITAEPRERRAYADAVAQSMSPLLRKLGHEHEGATLYFAKYFTPHPAGEPHYFVKPPALLATPPGFSTLIEGSLLESSEVMRGVVHTDRFFAVPQVFHVFTPFAPERIRRGDELCRLHLVPRRFATMKPSVRPLELLKA